MINRYKLKNNVTITEINNCGFNIPYKGADYFFLSKSLYKNDITVNIKIPFNLKFDDYENIIVLDESFGQPYTPFYEEATFLVAQTVINKYNKIMDSLGIFERIKDDDRP